MRYGLQVAGRRAHAFLALAFLATASALSGCGKVAEAPPRPEVLVVVDTNLPTPLVAGRLRVDLYAEDGTWFATSDFGRPDARDWPASFSVYSDDESRARLVWVRVRVHPEGAVDGYLGERFRDITDPFARVDGDEQPRIAKDGRDITPATEPTPLMTVDRLVLVRLEPQTRGRVRVLLHGACVGTMVKMGPAGLPVVGQSESCVAAEKEREVVAPLPLEVDTLSTPTATLVGTWLTGTCPPAAESDTRVCIPGGATILGSRENSEYFPGATFQLDPAPPRVFGLSPFFVDKNELTVKELTALVDSGYSGALPVPYDGVLAQQTVANKLTACTWSFKAKDRDDYSVTCASYRAARSICQYRGGDLLTEAQWEHVATVAGHRGKARYPWGDEQPTCERGIWGRIPLPPRPADCPLGDGPRRASEIGTDVSALGVRGLFGGVVEWVIDDAAPYASSAWAKVSIVDPVVVDKGIAQVTRGNSWVSSAQRPTFRFTPVDQDGYQVPGVRCAYPVKKP